MEEISKNEKSLRTAFYIRVSTEEQAEKYGIPSQLERLHGLVKAKGNLLPPDEKHIYIDDITGASPIEERPAFSRLMEDVENSLQENKPFDTVLVFKMDRFARKLKILLDAIDFFEDNNLKFISSQEMIDTSTPFGMAMLGIVGVIAELEVAVLHERTQLGKQEAIKKGKLMSKAPYGYIKDANGMPCVNKPQAKVVERIFDDFVNLKHTKYEIAVSLAEEEIVIPKYSTLGGKKAAIPDSRAKNGIYYWREGTVGNILSNEFYTGKYYYNKSKDKKDLPKDKWELSETRHVGIINENVFFKAQNLLKTSKRLTAKNRKSHIYLLSGLLKCGHCYDEERDVTGMVSWHGVPKNLKKQGKSYYYQCPRKNKSKSQIECHTLPMPSKELEKFVINYLIDLLRNPVRIMNYQQKLKSTKIESAKLKKKETRYVKLLNAIPFQKEQIMKLNIKGHMSDKKFDKEVRALEEKRARITKQLCDVKFQLAKGKTSEYYIKPLELFSEKHINVLQEFMDNRKETFDIIHQLVEEIIVYSRPADEKDVIAGKKPKVQQYIPNKLHIKLKLPQEFLQELADKSNQKYEEFVLQQLKELGHDVKFKEGFEVKKSLW